MLRVWGPVLLGAFAAFSACAAAVHVWQDSIELPTYAEQDPDPAPQFAAFKPDQPNYPYPVRSHLSALAADRSMVRWRTLNLENEYLFCRILPDLGGHLYSCRDKLNQREVFYANPVIKKDLIGLRGAWIATGIEPNFPATHSRTSASPVNFFIRSNADGSAGVIVADTDRVTGLEWRVEYRLRPETAVLEEQVSLYNPTPVRRPYLWWNNAEIEWDDPGIRFIFPTHLVRSHDRKTIETWPVNSSGIDMSIAANQKTEATWFALGCRESFMAIYKPRSRTGVAHFADPKVVAGKKIWIMGDQIGYYRQHITDGGNVYIEMQAGLFADQQSYEFLQPEQSRTFTEYWIPFRDLDGLTRATPDAILYAQRSGADAVKIEVETTHPVSGAAIRVIAGARVVSESVADLDPKSAWTQTVKIPAHDLFAIQILDRQGRVLLEHDEGLYAADGAGAVKPGPQKVTDWNGAPSEWLLSQRGEYNELTSQIAFARHDYADGLQTFPQDPLLNEKDGRLDVSLLRFDEASSRLEARLRQRDPEALYYAGVAQSLAGHDGAARTLLAQASASRAFAAPAQLQLALIAARAHDFAGALKLPAPSPADPLQAARIGGIGVALRRRSGDSAGAAAELEKVRAAAPEDPFLRYEATLAGRQDPALWSYLAGDSQRVLDLADEYLQLGMPEDALTLLRHDFSKDNPIFLEPGAVPPDFSALVAYYRAYCEILLKQDAAADLRKASGFGTRYAFPYRAVSYAVLRSAIAKNPSDATAHALLGDLEMYSFRTGDAIGEWQRAITLNPKLEVERNMITKAAALLRANPAPAAIRENVADAAHRDSPPAAAAARSIPGDVHSPVAVAESAMLESASGSPDSAAAAFERAEFSAEKQPDEVRRAYTEVQLQKLLALSHSGKCEDLDDRIQDLSVHDNPRVPFTFYGLSEFTRVAHFQYYLGVAEANCGRLKEARKYWSKVAKMKEPASSPDFAYPLLAAARMDAPDARQAAAGAMKEIASGAGLDGGVRAFSEAVLLRISGQEGPAAARFAEALRSQDAMVQYLATIELARQPQ